VRRTTCQPHLSAIAQAARRFSLFDHCANARRNRCQDLNNSPFGELEETTGTPSYYMDKKLSSRTWNPITCPWIKQLMWLKIAHSGDWC